MSEPVAGGPGGPAADPAFDSSADSSATPLRVCLVHVAGRVQGVYFRAHTATGAAALGVRGYARNLDDGRVEVLAGGHPQAIEQLITHVRRGPPLAHVTSGVVTELAPQAIDGHAGFARE